MMRLVLVFLVLMLLVLIVGSDVGVDIGAVGAVGGAVLDGPSPSEPMS